MIRYECSRETTYARRSNAAPRRSKNFYVGKRKRVRQFIIEFMHRSNTIIMHSTTVEFARMEIRAISYVRNTSQFRELSRLSRFGTTERRRCCRRRRCCCC